MLQSSAAQPQPSVDSLPFSMLPFAMLPFSMLPFSMLPFAMLPFSVLPFSVLPFSVLPFSMLPFSVLPFSVLAGGLARRFLSVARYLWVTGKRRKRFSYMALHSEHETLCGRFLNPQS